RSQVSARVVVADCTRHKDEARAHPSEPDGVLEILVPDQLFVELSCPEQRRAPAAKEGDQIDRLRLVAGGAAILRRAAESVGHHRDDGAAHDSIVARHHVPDSPGAVRPIAIQRIDAAFDIARLVGRVRIQAYDHVAAGPGDTDIKRARGYASRILEQADKGIRIGVSSHDLARSIFAHAVHHQDFHAIVRIAVAYYRVETGPDELRFVAARNQYRERRQIVHVRGGWRVGLRDLLDDARVHESSARFSREPDCLRSAWPRVPGLSG